MMNYRNFVIFESNLRSNKQKEVGVAQKFYVVLELV